AQHADRRRLAGAVRPQDAEDLAGEDRERDVVDRGHLAEAFDQVAQLDDRRAVERAHRAPALAFALVPAGLLMPVAPTVASMRGSAGRPALSAPPVRSSTSFTPNTRFACSSSVSAARGVNSASRAMLTTRPWYGCFTPTGRTSTAAPSFTFVSSGAA